MELIRLLQENERLIEELGFNIATTVKFLGSKQFRFKMDAHKGLFLFDYYDKQDKMLWFAKVRDRGTKPRANDMAYILYSRLESLLRRQQIVVEDKENEGQGT